MGIRGRVIRVASLLAACALFLPACRSGDKSPSATDAAPLSPPTPVSPVDPGPMTTPRAPTSAELACRADSDCAVARVSVSGPDACCASCATTAGSKRWYAALHRACAGKQFVACPPLACPLGPTGAVCRQGRCEATGTWPDGGTALVLETSHCLPAMVCQQWAGCARVWGNEQDGWFVGHGDKVTRGDPATLVSVAVGDASVRAAVVVPDESNCPAGPQAGLPPYTCAMVEDRCRAR